MINTSTPFFDWLMDMLRAIAEIRTPFLDKFMNIISMLGQETIFMLFALVIFYCVSKREGYKYLFAFNFGVLINQFLKLFFRIPRPWIIDSDFEIVELAREGASGWSFPSTHAMSAPMLYGGVAMQFKKRRHYIAAGIFVLLVAFSRMYLGVHTLLDVGVGLILGTLILIFSSKLFDKYGGSVTFINLALGISTAFTLVLVIVSAASDSQADAYAGSLKNACALFGMAFGVFCGNLVERKFINFDTKSVWWVNIIKVGLGFGILLGLRAALKPLFALITDSPFIDIARYAVIGFVSVGVYPACFKLLNALSVKKS